MKKHILVTGSEGYIGTLVIQMLLKEGYEVTGLDACFFKDGNLDNSILPNYKLIKKDIRDVKKEDLENKNFFAVIHLAALSNDPLGMLDEQLTLDINYHASVNLAKISKELGIERFLFSSSCSLYGDGNGKILDETSISNPQTTYGKSKILAESEISKIADESFSPTFMRNATAFGFSPRMRFDIVVNSLSGFAKVDKEIKILGDGTPWRPLVHVQDICKAFLKVLESPLEKVHNQAFNIGSNSENYQIKEIASHVQSFFTDCAITIAQENAGDTRDYNVSFEKFENELSFNIDYSLDKGIGTLQKIYDEIGLNHLKFEHKFYTRLKQINYLLENGYIGKDLRWL
jgi:nucleoside-diphosphate-sugar epimerase